MYVGGGRGGKGDEAWGWGGGGGGRGDTRESRDSTCIVARFQSYREASMKMFLRISRGISGAAP